MNAGNEQFEFLAGGEGKAAIKVTKGFLSAYRKGRRAARKGLQKLPPYKPANDWRRVFRSFWSEGWEDERAGRGERYE